MLRHGIGGYEDIILLLMVVLVFGSKRLPDTAKPGSTVSGFVGRVSVAWRC